MDNYFQDLKNKVILDLDDLKNKLVTNEPFPEKECDVDTLIQISDNIDECLNNWYY